MKTYCEVFNVNIWVSVLGEKGTKQAFMKVYLTQQWVQTTQHFC